MKNLKKLKGIKMLSKTEQKVIAGGARYCNSEYLCLPGWYCYYPSGANSGWCIRGQEP